MKVMLFVAMVASLYGVALTLGLVVMGRPPIHCRYLVPVRGAAPGVYSCSQYPRPVEVLPEYRTP